MAKTKTRAPAGRLYAGQTLDARVTERRRSFIEAGKKLIGTRGYGAATVRAVCTEAGLTDRYFYESFDDTEALLIAVYREISDQLRGAITTAIAGATPSMEAKLDAGLGAFVGFMRDPLATRILLMEVLGVSPKVTLLYLQTSAGFAETLLREIEVHVPALARHPADRETLGHALVGAMTYAAAAWAMSGYSRPASQVIRNCRRLLFGTVRQYAEEMA